MNKKKLNITANLAATATVATAIFIVLNWLRQAWLGYSAGIVSMELQPDTYVIVAGQMILLGLYVLKILIEGLFKYFRKLRFLLKGK